MLNRRQVGFGLIAATSFPSSACPEEVYPSRPVRYVVPFVPGGATDIVARLIGEQLTVRLGQRFYVDNRGGAGGLVGSRLVVDSQPDGYTIGGLSFSFPLYPFLFKDIGAKLLKDTQPITQVAVYPSVLLVNSSSPYKTVHDIVEAAARMPGKLQFASSGVGTAAHIAGELLNRDAGIKMAHVPYKGGGTANADLMAGQVTMHFANIGSASGFVKSGLLRPIAVAMPNRIEAFPEIPTMIEAGYRDFVINEFQGIFAARHTPPQIVDRLYSEIRAVLTDRAMKDRFGETGGEIVASSPDAFAQFIKDDSAKWIEVAQSAGVSAAGLQ